MATSALQANRCEMRSEADPATSQGDPIAVVDDDEAISASLSVLLQAYGFDVFEYESGKALLADRRRSRIGCLIIDQHMPGMAGLDVVAALHEEGIMMPIILITGRPDPAITGRAAKLGVLAVMEKPFAAAHLLAAIHAGLANRG